jgi:hypothetical protein
MTWISAFAAAALTLTALTADAQEVEVADHFRPLAFLAGSCWHGPFPDGQKIDSHCFKWFQRGRYLRERNELIGSDPPYGGETTYYWDPDRKAIAYIYLAVDGGISTGSVVVEDGIIKFPNERYVGSEGELKLRSEVVQTGPDEHRRQSWILGQDGSATPMLNATYVRKPLNW